MTLALFTHVVVLLVLLHRNTGAVVGVTGPFGDAAPYHGRSCRGFTGELIFVPPQTNVSVRARIAHSESLIQQVLLLLRTTTADCCCIQCDD